MILSVTRNALSRRKVAAVNWISIIATNTLYAKHWKKVKLASPEFVSNHNQYVTKYKETGIQAPATAMRTGNTFKRAKERGAKQSSEKATLRL